MKKDGCEEAPDLVLMGDSIRVLGLESVQRALPFVIPGVRVLQLFSTRFVYQLGSQINSDEHHRENEVNGLSAELRKEHLEACVALISTSRFPSWVLAETGLVTLTDDCACANVISRALEASGIIAFQIFQSPDI